MEWLKIDLKIPLKSVNYLEERAESPYLSHLLKIDLEDAKELVLNMHGEYRIPTLLKKVDRLSRYRYME